MYTKYFTLTAALLSVVSAIPLTKRGCDPGTFNCIDGSHYAQCIADGTWSATMSVAPGTSCQTGISTNPFVAGGSTSNTPTTSSPAPVNNNPPPPTTTNTGKTTDSGSSSPSTGGNTQGFAPISSWPSWSSMKAKYQPIMGTYCETAGWGANNSPSESAQVLSAIESLSGTVDPRFVLATVIQESSGCVRVPTTNNGVRNPGLLQDNNGSHTCNEGGAQNPCPVDEINGMIADGVSGGSNNLQSALAWAVAQGLPDSLAYAAAARMYNSGSVDLSDLNNGLGSTPAYVQQVMDRVSGTLT